MCQYCVFVFFSQTCNFITSPKLICSNNDSPRIHYCKHSRQRWVSKFNYDLQRLPTLTFNLSSISWTMMSNRALDSEPSGALTNDGVCSRIADVFGIARMNLTSRGIPLGTVPSFNEHIPRNIRPNIENTEKKISCRGYTHATLK